MSRSEREANLKALLGEKGYGEVFVSELGGRKRDKKKAIVEGLERGLRERMEPHHEEEDEDEDDWYSRWMREVGQ